MVRRRWTLRGLRPSAPCQTRYQWGYLYSTVEVEGQNAAEFACLPGGSLELSHLLLERLAVRDPEAGHVVIWDQAGFHPQPDLQELPAHVHVLPLPPYSPQLNPVEVIGDVIKDRIANTRRHTLEAMEEALGKILRPICHSAEGVRMLGSHSWLIEQVCATATENSAIAN